MEFAEVLEAYTNLGILGLIAVVFVWLVILSFKQRQENAKSSKELETESSKQVLEQQKEIIDMIREQNSQYQKIQEDMMKMFAQNVIKGVVEHVPSLEETKQLDKVSREIGNILQSILDESHGDRVGLMQYHNGGRGISKQSFLKMSITNERVKIGVTPQMQNFKDQFRGVMDYFTLTIEKDGYCYVDDYEKLKDISPTLYEFCKMKGMEAGFAIGVKDNNGVVIGYVYIEYIHRTSVKRAESIEALQKHVPQIQSLLNIKV